MARPSVVRLPDGEITLKGFSKERTEELKKLLLGLGIAPNKIPEVSLNSLNTEITVLAVPAKTYEADEVTYGAESVEEELKELIKVEDLPHLAIGLHKDSTGSYHITNVRYNDDVAAVHTNREVGASVHVAHQELRIEVGKKLLV